MIDRLRELLRAATPGPWKLSEAPAGVTSWGIVESDSSHDAFGEVADTLERADAALIVEAVNALPELLDAHDRMAGALAESARIAHAFAALMLNGSAGRVHAVPFETCIDSRCAKWRAALAVPKEENPDA